MKQLSDTWYACERDGVFFSAVLVIGLVGKATALPDGTERVDDVGQRLNLLQPLTECHIRIATEACTFLFVYKGGVIYQTARLQRFWRAGEDIFVETQNRCLQFLLAPRPGFFERLRSAITA